ncbi:hypothetical protein M2451_000537 [Dysgonomonas sp. PFB1-18]|nr:hypothetical protein [Dysgonomonas sp. PF1-14]MDH6337306.1 hypothetical protein [Dysgonomonas sp. PF1-16]MDH6379230.1 hypothetical protein [Dysgonomonas sp. PFB1-18]MDH6396132.1 hypothetical protein [Dysgonomonas sp. PF1-23]
MRKKVFDEAPLGKRYIFRRWITINGKRVYPRNGKCFKILVEV